MDGTGFAMMMLALGVALGLLLATTTYAMELRRMARFLRRRDAGSNERLTVRAAAPGLTALADAVNGELDRAAEARVMAQRHAKEFQRDLSSLSHDVRTPLMGAKGYLQLAEAEPDGATRRRHLDAAVSRIDGTTDLLDRLFSYAKASDPDLTLDMKPLTLRPLVEGVLLGHYPEFEERGWEPALDFEDAELSVAADKASLTRVVENLVTNAIRYGAAAPRIVQRGRAVVFANRVAEPEAIDTARLFERFYQADSARGGKGAGLGLATAARLADAMGMRLEAEMEGDELRIRLAV